MPWSDRWGRDTPRNPEFIRRAADRAHRKGMVAIFAGPVLLGAVGLSLEFAGGSAVVEGALLGQLGGIAAGALLLSGFGGWNLAEAYRLRAAYEAATRT